VPGKKRHEEQGTNERRTSTDDSVKVPRWLVNTIVTWSGNSIVSVVVHFVLLYNR
jgi:hypothetical protein